MIPRYFDWAATTIMCEEALDAYRQAALEHPGNPSSLHKAGVDAAQFLKRQRETTARILGVEPKRITYTSGATESNSIAILSQLWKRKPGRVIFSSIEHDSVMQHQHILEQKGFEVVILPASGGYLDPAELTAALTDDTLLVCIMLVSNLLGTIQPVKEIVSATRAFCATSGKDIHVHCDAVQALGKIPLDIGSMGVDSMAFSAHKFQGPRGVGILYQKGNTLTALSRGGGQEQGLRAGTENIAGIAALNAALVKSVDAIPQNLPRAYELRKLFLAEVEREGCVQALSPHESPDKPVSPYIIALTVPSVPSEIFSRVMYDRGFCISSGSACSNNARQKSDTTLISIGYSQKQSAGAVRISFGPDTTGDEMILLARTMQEEALKLQKVLRKH
jgi:cysteine desulfurase